MKKSIIGSAALALSIFSCSYLAKAEDTSASKSPSAMTSEQNQMPAKGMMDGKMNMKKMKTMMQNCRDSHNEEKMCEGQAMEECQKDMTQKKCMKMMKKMVSHKK